MQVDGRIEGGYRCSAVRSGKCWNKATSLREDAHQWISKAIIRQLESLDDHIDRLLSDAGRLLDDGGHRQARLAEVTQKRIALEKKRERIGRAIGLSDQKVEYLVSELERVQARLDRLDAVAEKLKQKERLCAMPTRAEIERRRTEICDAIRKMDRGSQAELKTLVGEIRAIPYQQFDGNKVVLRARFELRLAALLPARVQAALKGLGKPPVHEQFDHISMLVNLFNPSTGPEHGLEALKLKEEEGLGPTAVGRRLGITKRQAHLAYQYAVAMRAAGITHPYAELTESPKAASRWRTHPAHQQSHQSPDSSSEEPDV